MDSMVNDLNDDDVTPDTQGVAKRSVQDEYVSELRSQSSDDDEPLKSLAYKKGA